MRTTREELIGMTALLHLVLLVVFLFIPIAGVIMFTEASGPWNEHPLENVVKPCPHYEVTSKDE